MFPLQSSSGARVDVRVPATVVLALAAVTFFIDLTRFPWRHRQRSFWDRIGEV